MRKVGLIVGTRPEVIKMAPVYWALRSHSVEAVVIFSGQHANLVDGLFEKFEIPVDISLAVMEPGQSLNGLFARVLSSVDDLLDRIHFDLVLVHGDTTTAAASAIACFNRLVRIGHVEAGLRTGDLARPFPEELNRTLIARVAGLHFCPTQLSASNLEAEGLPMDSVYVVGNTIVDAVDFVRKSHNGMPNWASMPYCNKYPDLAQLINSDNMQLLLTTLHRRENIENLPAICEELKQLVAENADIFIVLPIHKNPTVSSIVKANLGGVPRVFLIDSPDYFDFVPLIMRARVIVTDSGGIQEEAFILGKPLVILRKSTERPEVLNSLGTVLIGDSYHRIPIEVKRLLALDFEFATDAAIAALGDGATAKRIASICEDYFNETPILGR